MRYLLNGREAEDQAYVTALDAGDPDEAEFVNIIRVDGTAMTVSGDTGDYRVNVANSERAEWCIEESLTRQQVAYVIEAFVAGDDSWREQFGWERVGYSSREQTKRLLPVLLIGALLFAIVWGILRKLQ